MAKLFDDLSAVQNLVCHSPFGLIVDIDGTIAPIAPAPELARVTPTCKRHLRSLAKLLPLVAAVSGRPAQEARRLVGIASMVYVGNHGLERWEKGKVKLDPLAAKFRQPIREALRDLASALAEPGVVFEDKGATASIHYRLTPDPASARGRIIDEIRRIASDKGLRVTEGRMVVEIRPPVDVDKGTAVMRLVGAHRLKSALYLGDDVTDLDAFAALRSWRLRGEGLALSVAVLNSESGDRLADQADAYLRGIADVERLLAWLCEVVSKSAPCARSS